MKLKITKILVLAVVLSNPVLADIVINEIMYNPPGSDNNREFIEIYSDGSVNLSGYRVFDLESGDTLELIKYFNSNYSLIVEEGFNHSGINASIYSVGTTIGNNLNNDYDIISLYDLNLTIIANASYDNTYANGNGKSLEILNITWFESTQEGGTPGRENSIIPQNTTNQTNSTNNSTDMANQTNQTNTNVDMCDRYNISLNIFTEKEIYDDSEKVKFDFILSNSSIPFIIEYWVEDLQGIMVKNKLNTTNLNQKSWTPNIDESDKTFIIKARLYFNSNCTINTSAFNMITVKSNKSYSSNSSIEIKEIYLKDDKAEFGGSFRVRLMIYKGDSSKSVVEAWLENDDSTKISQISKSTLYDKFTQYDLTVPVQLKTNCNKKYPDGTYNLVVSGLDLIEKRQIDVSGNIASSCDVKDGEDGKSNGSGSSGGAFVSAKADYEITKYPEEIELNKEVITKVRISNPSYNSHNFTLWGYVYRGSKCYSGKREENRQTILLDADGSQVVELKNIVSDADVGEYKLKVKIIKDNQKTEHELTKDIKIINSSLSNIEDVEHLLMENSENVQPDSDYAKKQEITSKEITMDDTEQEQIVYESTSAKIKKTIVYFVLGLFVLVIGLIVWYR